MKFEKLNANKFNTVENNEMSKVFGGANTGITISQTNNNGVDDSSETTTGDAIPTFKFVGRKIVLD